MTYVRQPKTPITVKSIKDEELYGILIKAPTESQDLGDDAILRKLYAAEDFYEQDCLLRWQPTRVFSDVFGRQHATFPAGIAVLPSDYDEINDIDEPAYDYTHDFWGNEKWGWFDLSYRPVRDVTRIFFAFPGTKPVFQVPTEWMRLDRKFGRVQLIPTTSMAVYATFNAFIMGVIAGGRGLPQSIYVDYTTGFTTDLLLAHHQHLLEGVRLRTILSLFGIIGTIVSQGKTSSSLGMDGLSRSQGFQSGKYGPYSGRIELSILQEEAIRTSWKGHERGPMVAFA